MTQEEQQKRIKYVDAKMELSKKLIDKQTEVKRLRLAIIAAENDMREIEGEIFQLVNRHADRLDGEAAQAWHDVSEIPDDAEAWYLADFKGVPIITHYLGSGWLDGIRKWMKIEL